ncbi:uncharacterized protein [Diadema setosum]|uniref:uncharacterized protein n=1 Tax=Diadema setosum TaxID=31175 RepID=UPI003B3AA8E8
MVDLQQELSDLMGASRSQNTHAVYRQAHKSFRKFFAIYFPGEYASFSDEQVALFISYLSLQGYAASIICAYVAGLSFHLPSSGLPDVTKHFVVGRLLEGCRRRRTRADTRYPVTMSLLEKLLPCLTRVCTSYEAVLFKACFTVAFFGFLRVGEFTGISRSATVASLRINDVLTRRTFTEVLRKCLSFLNLPASRFASHSFRIGAATSAAMAGFDASAIQRMGRWATDTHTRYVRINMLDEL